MQTSFNKHAGEEVLERYSMGTLRGGDLASLEEHLFICTVCQERLRETDQYVQAMRAAAAKLRHERSWSWLEFLRCFLRIFTTRKLIWTAGVAVLVLLGFLVATPWRDSRLHSPPVTVILHSSRGIQNPAIAKVKGDESFLLRVDLTDLPKLPAYRIEVVDAQGSAVWESTGRSSERWLSVLVQRRLDKGAYWVRLYAGGAGERLLREFGLQVD
jgi:hypothetical protein